MSDFNSSLPVRTQNNGDVVAKIGDGTTPSQQLAIDSTGRITTKMNDGAGNAVTSQTNGAQRALDVGINVAGVQIDPRLIRALTSADVVSVVQSTSPWVTKDQADGPVAPGTAASFSELVGGQFNTTLPTLTNGQQAAIQVDSSGRLLVNIAASAGSISVTQGTTPWLTKDSSDGSVAAGTAGTTSMLGGLVFNTAAPTLTNGQQAALQGDASANLLVNLKTPLPTGTNSIGNIGTVATVTAVTAITNALPTGSNTIGAVNQGTAGTAAQGWFTKITDGTNTTAVKAASTAALATDPSLVVALSPNSPLPAGTAAIGSVLANIQVAGSAVTALNPVPVQISPVIPGTPIDSYNTAASIAAAATSNHDYTVTAAKTFFSKQMYASASGKLKIEVQYETAAASGVFNSFFVGFNSTATPEILIPVPTEKTQVTGARIRIIRTNLDLASQDVYSTISGTEQ